MGLSFNYYQLWCIVLPAAGLALVSGAVAPLIGWDGGLDGFDVSAAASPGGLGTGVASSTAAHD